MLDQIHTHLDALGLPATRAHVEDALKKAQKTKPSYSAFLLELLRKELEHKRNRILDNALHRSGLIDFWALETFPWHLQPTANKRLILELAELDFLDRGESLVFMGPAGVGKSALAGGLLLKALFAGRKAQCIRAADLFEEFGRSHADRSTARVLKRFSRLDLLLVDEFGYVNSPVPAQINDFFRLMDNRCNRKSTLITTNLDFPEWGAFLGNRALTKALTSRLLQNCQVINLHQGIDLREPKHKLPTRSQRPAVLQLA
jgi:DNA replication protein DnaC